LAHGLAVGEAFMAAAHLAHGLAVGEAFMAATHLGHICAAGGAFMAATHLPHAAPAFIAAQPPIRHWPAAFLAAHLGHAQAGPQAFAGAAFGCAAGSSSATPRAQRTGHPVRAGDHASNERGSASAITANPAQNSSFLVSISNSPTGRCFRILSPNYTHNKQPGWLDSTVVRFCGHPAKNSPRRRSRGCGRVECSRRRHQALARFCADLALEPALGEGTILSGSGFDWQPGMQAQQGGKNHLSGRMWAFGGREHYRESRGYRARCGC